jgi:hypothetical protein
MRKKWHDLKTDETKCFEIQCPYLLKLLSAEEDEGVSYYLVWVVGGVNTSLGDSIVWNEKLLQI